MALTDKEMALQLIQQYESMRLPPTRHLLGRFNYWLNWAVKAQEYEIASRLSGPYIKATIETEIEESRKLCRERMKSAL